MDKKILLSEKEIPEQWYNILHDMLNKPVPPLHPGTKEPIDPDALAPLKKKTILFNLCGHGYFDMQAYDDYVGGKLVDHKVTKEEIDESLVKIAALQVS